MKKVEGKEKEVLKETKNRKKSRVKFILLLVLIVSILAYPTYRFLKYYLKTDINKITMKVSKSVVDESEFERKGKDKEYRYSYIDSYVIIKKGIDKAHDDIAVFIQEYNSDVEAEEKLNFLENTLKTIEDEFEDTNIYDFYDVSNKVDMNYDYYTNGKYLIGINTYYEEDTKPVKDKIDKIIKKYGANSKNNEDSAKVNKYWSGITEKIIEDIKNSYQEKLDDFNKELKKAAEKISKCSGNECEEIYNEWIIFQSYEELSEGINELKEAYNKVVQDRNNMVNQINSYISKAEKSSSKSDYDNAKKLILELSDSYYEGYKEEWNNRLKKCEEAVYKNSASKYKYKDILRNPDAYKGKTAYFFGKVVQKVDSKTFRVGVDCSKNRYATSGYVCDNYIYVKYSGGLNMLEDDIVKLWGDLDGTVTYETVLHNNLTIPSLNAKYAELVK